MLKSFLRLILCLAAFFHCNAQPVNKPLHQPNYIDSIRFAKQIETLLLTIDKNQAPFKVNRTLQYQSRISGNNCKKISDSLKIKPWTKADFDNNGLTDILIVGSWGNHHILCILDKGANQYEIKSITRDVFLNCTFAVVSDNKIDYYFDNYPHRDKPLQLEHIKLVYQYGDFVEENPAPATNQVEKIEYSTSACLLMCPVYQMTINKDKTAKWNAGYFNEINGREFNGDYITNITDDKYNNLVSLLNYIDFSKLDNDYAVGWTDDQSGTLTITYDAGKTKTIKDYGLIGTYGLNRVYQLLSELISNQKWMEQTRPEGQR